MLGNRGGAEGEREKLGESGTEEEEEEGEKGRKEGYVPARWEVASAVSPT